MAADLGSRVLVADGDPAWRQRLFTRLLDLDIFSDCVGNGQDALRQLSEIRYTVVVLDLGLPNGIGATQVLQRLAQLETRPLVLATAGEEAARALEVDIVQMVLRKPVDIDQMTELVRNCVRSVAARRGVVVPPEDHGEDRIRS